MKNLDAVYAEKIAAEYTVKPCLLYTSPLFHTVIHIPFFIMRLCGLCASFCGKSGAEDVYKTQENYKKG